MTRTALLLAIFAMGAVAQNKSLPNQAGNSKLGLSGTAITDRKAITDLLGVDLGPGYVVVKLKATPQTPAALRLSIDDFTLVSRKNGEKSGAMAPSAIFGSGTMVVRGGGAQGPDRIGERANPDVIRPPVGTVGTPIPRNRLPGANGQTGGIGNGGTIEGGLAEVDTNTRRLPDDPRLEVLESKVFPESETKDPVEGLLYFQMDQKLQPKNLGLIYSGQAGRLVIDFK